MNIDLAEKLQREHGDIFVIQFAGSEYYYRPLTVAEIKESEYIKDDLEKEEFFLEACVVYPENVDFDVIPAGYVNTLVELIMDVSGILNLNTVIHYLDESRERISVDPINMMKAYIIAAIPSYRDDDLDAFSIKGLIEKVTLSEQILTLQQAIMGIQTEGVKIHIVPLEEAEKASNHQDKLDIDKEELLRRIRQNERDTVDARKREAVASNLEDIDEDILLKMTGQVDSSDPIAAKLHGKKK